VTITDTNRDPALLPKFFGLSSDTKPTKAPTGSSFYETDTKHGFVFDGAGWVRSETVAVEQAATVSVQELLPSAVLDELLVQLKIANAYLSRVTGEELDETDIRREAV
jgi:hypothetical protein